MIDTERRYTQSEARDLKLQGYEFVSVQGFGDPQPVFRVSRYTPPEPSGDMEFCPNEFGYRARD